MTDCGCHHEAKNAQERRILTIALVLNAAMAVIGGVAGWIGQSTGLLADALDMLSDATAYAIGLAAIGRGARFKANAAWLSGSVLLVLGEKRYRVKKGGSFYFRPTRLHYLANPGKAEARVLWVSTPPSF